MPQHGSGPPLESDDDEHSNLQTYFKTDEFQSRWSWIAFKLVFFCGVESKQTPANVSGPIFIVSRDRRRSNRQSSAKILDRLHHDRNVRMSSQYAFAPYQDPPEDIPAHEREQAAFASASHYSSEEPAASQGEPFIGGDTVGDARINQYETSLPFR